MRDFFKGWRRKVGCITLVMACVLMGIWMRSRIITDQVWKDHRRYGSMIGPRRFAISGGAIYWIRQEIWWDRVFMSEPMNGHWKWISEPYHNLGMPDGFRYLARRWIPGAEIAETGPEMTLQENPFLDERIFYWKCSLLWLIVPLTLMSARLLFATPRKRRDFNSAILKASSD